MTREEWDAATDPAVLLGFASGVIRREHLALVLCEILELAWPQWHYARRDDWELAWQLATVRAWSLGEISREELEAQWRGEPLEDDGEEDEELAALDDDEPYDENGEPYADRDDADFDEHPLDATPVALARLLRVLRDDRVASSAAGVASAVILGEAAIAEQRLSWRLDALYAANDEERDAVHRADDRRPDEPFSEEILGAEALRHDEEEALEAELRGIRVRVINTTQANVLEIIRRAIAYRSTPATDWQVSAVDVLSGGALLRLDGGRIVDAVLGKDISGLSPERAVALDAHLERTGRVLYQRALPNRTDEKS